MKWGIWILLTLVCFSVREGRAWTLMGAGISGWETRQLSVHVNPTNCPISAEALIAAVDQAITTWNGVPTANILLSRAAQLSTTDATTFLHDTATESPLILCDPNFAADNQGDPQQVPAATTATVLSPDGDNLDYAGIVLNAQPGALASVATLSPQQLAVTLAHELGHVLGLGHSSNQLALMFYSLGGKTSAVLTDDDRDGLAYLYPRDDFAGGSFGCEAVHPRGSPASLGWIVVFVALNLCASRWLLRRRHSCPG